MKIIILLGFLFAPLTASAKETKFFVDGMTCLFCAKKVESVFRDINGYGVASVDIKSIETGEVIVTTKGNKPLTKEIIKEKLKEAGFTLRSITGEKDHKN